MYKRYIVVKEIVDGDGKIPVGTQLDIVRGVVYMNGGMLDTYFQGYFGRLIEREEENGFKYLKPEKPVKDKI
jgi:hypothetical protein